LRPVVAEAPPPAPPLATSAFHPPTTGDGRRVRGGRSSDEVSVLLAPLRHAGKGVVALLPANVISPQEVADLQQEVGRPVTWTARLTVKVTRTTRVSPCNDESRPVVSRSGPGVLPPARVPDEPG